MTGLANRHLLNDRPTQALNLANENKHTIGIIFIELDLFKYINDTLGHTVGDYLLIEVAQRIQACVVKEDTVTLRSSCLGGIRNSDRMHIIKEEIVDYLKNTLLNT